jgi:hypothetical protein
MNRGLRVTSSERQHGAKQAFVVPRLDRPSRQAV